MGRDARRHEHAAQLMREVIAAEQRDHMLAQRGRPIEERTRLTVQQAAQRLLGGGR